MAERFFGTDGFRGPVDHTLEPQRINGVTFEQLAYDFAHMEGDRSDSPPTFIVGSDTRLSGPGLREAVTAGLAKAGAEVWDVGIAPTPAIAWLAQTYDASAIAITASHNPNSDNGFKPFEKGGTKPSRDTLDELETRYRKSLISPSAVADRKGKVQISTSLLNAYVDAVVDRAGGQGVLEGKHILIDAGNGAAYELAPLIFKKLGTMPIKLACSNDGANINKGYGAAHLEGVKDFLAEHIDLARRQNFLGAFANDGDADRVMGVDRFGRTIDGNYWLSQLANQQRGIVGTIYTNSALRQAVNAMGVEFHECDNGDSHVTAMLQDLTQTKGQGYCRGGEFTGHMIDLDHLPSGDGLYMGAWLAVHLARQGKTLTDLHDELKLWPERMIGVQLAGNAREVLEHPTTVDAIDQERAKLGQYGRIIVRASGTEPLIRVWAEAVDTELLDKTMANLTKAVAG